MTEPCQLWPNHPWPLWLQTPLAVLGIFLCGTWTGWAMGVMWTHHWHYKVKPWLESKNKP